MQEPRILDRLHQQYSGKRVRDVHMVLEGTARDSTLLYVPGYLFDYMYGEVKDDSLEITKQHHQALVPAAGASLTIRLSPHAHRTMLPCISTQMRAAQTDTVENQVFYHSSSLPDLHPRQ